MASPQKKKIAFLLPTLTAGGAERVLITLMNGLDRARFAPEFIVLDETGPLRPLIAPGIPIHSLNHQKVRSSMPKIAQKINQLAPDIVVSTITALNFALLLAKPLIKKKPKVIVRESTLPSAIISKQAAPLVVKTAYRSLYPHADIILSPAQCIVDELKELGLKKSNHALLHNPVDTARIRNGNLPPRKDPGVTRFVAGGRLHEEKGFGPLITALPGLESSWHLSIFGEGPEQENLQRLIETNGLGANIRLAGYSNSPWTEYAAADALLLPSPLEGLPNVALEALCAGTPVIAMRAAGGIGEIAALAPPGAIMLAENMDDFIDTMKTVRPGPASSFRPSLLPAQFNLENINRKFAELLV